MVPGFDDKSIPIPQFPNSVVKIEYMLPIFDILKIVLKKGGLELLDKTALILVIIGALNWGLIGLFGFDLVATLFGGQSALLSRIVYSIVGLAGLYSITLLFREKTEVQ